MARREYAKGSMTQTTEWAESVDVPPGGQLEGYVWWCGDEYCDCTEAHIELITPNEKVGLPWVTRDPLWRGEFHTDGELGATTELNREAARLRRHHNALYHRIRWPWDQPDHR